MTYQLICLATNQNPLPKKRALTLLIINNSNRPVILAGHGALISDAGLEVMKLAETIDAQITTTLLGKGIVDENHQRSLGMLGMHGTAYANETVVASDLIISIGSRFDDRIIGQPEALS